MLQKVVGTSVAGGRSEAAQSSGLASVSRNGIVALVRLLFPHGAIEPKNGVDAAFEDLPGQPVLFVLTAAQLTFDVHVCAFG